MRRPVISTLQQLNFHAANLVQPYLANRAGRTFRKNLAVRTITTHCEKVTSENLEFEHLFRYTSGRWLWDEEQQLRDRYKAFNVGQLQNLAAQAVGSNSCSSIIKLAEGRFNKVFRLLMNDGKTVLARIPNPNAGPAFYTTASEVATMEFVSSSCQSETYEMAHVPVRLERSSRYPSHEY